MRRSGWRAILAVLVVVVVCAGPAAAPGRTWTDREGNQINARFVRLHLDNVILSLGSRVRSIPFWNLSAEDREYVRTEMERRGKGDEVPRLPPPPRRPGLGRGDFRRPARPSAIGEGRFGPAPPGKGAERAGPPRAPNVRAGPIRMWMDLEGNTIRAEFVTVSGYEVVLLEDGKEVSYPLVGLGIRDRQYVRSMLEKRGQGHLFPGAADPDDEATHLSLSPHDWRERLGQWRAWIRAKEPPPDGETPEAAKNHIRNISDPNAAKPLLHALSRESEGTVRAAYAEALARIGGADAVRTLVRLSVTDPSRSVRIAATWGIIGTGNVKEALPAYAPLVRSKKTRAEALAFLQKNALLSPVSSGELPDQAMTHALIDALVDVETKHVPRQWRRHQWYYWRDVIGQGRAWGSSTESRVVRVPVQVRHPQPIIHKTLADYTGEDYGYDQKAWRAWYQHRKETVEEEQ